jgi:hypothetical protein
VGGALPTLSEGIVSISFVIDPASTPAREVPQARRDDEARAEFLRGMSLVREGALLAAKAARRLERARQFVLDDCAGIGALGERRGASPKRAAGPPAEPANPS